jgi:DNA helicase-2/ATP-dependent DNA helicase PcrA
MDPLQGLNQEQLEAVTHFQGPLLIIAGAGSGKTRVITHRIAYLIGHHRVRFTILDEADSLDLFGEIVKELGLEPLSPALLAQLIERAKDNLLEPADLHRRYEGRLDDHLLEAAYSAYRRYEQALERSNSLDFADLIRLTVRLFREEPQVLSHYQERFRFILIDEYQDINYAQYIFTKLLTGREKNICVVGMTTKRSTVGAGPIRAGSSASRRTSPRPRSSASG